MEWKREWKKEWKGELRVAKKVLRLSAQGMTPEEIARRLDLPLGKVKQIIE